MSEPDNTAKRLVPSNEFNEFVRAVQNLTSHVERLTRVVAPPPKGDEAERRQFDAWFVDLAARIGVRPFVKSAARQPGGSTPS